MPPAMRGPYAALCQEMVPMAYGMAIMDTAVVTNIVEGDAEGNVVRKAYLMVYTQRGRHYMDIVSVDYEQGGEVTGFIQTLLSANSHAACLSIMERFLEDDVLAIVEA